MLWTYFLLRIFELFLNPICHFIFYSITCQICLSQFLFFTLCSFPFLRFFFLRLHIPTAFFLFPQAPSQSESEPEKAQLCGVPPPPSSAFVEMSGDHTQSSASKISEDVDKEDEFGYSWSKLSFFDTFNYEVIKNSSEFLKVYYALDA